MGRFCRCGLLIAVAAALVPSARAQAGSAAVTGFVRDSSAAPVPGAAIALVEVSTGQTRHAISSSEGLYAFVGMRPGAYRLTVALAGFRPLARCFLRLRTGETVRLDLELSIGSVAEAVTVAADLPAVQSSSGSL